MKDWLLARKKWVVAVLLLLGLVGEYATGTIGLEDALKKGMGIVESTKVEQPATPPATPTLKGQ